MKIAAFIPEELATDPLPLAQYMDDVAAWEGATITGPITVTRKHDVLAPHFVAFLAEADAERNGAPQ